MKWNIYVEIYIKENLSYSKEKCISNKSSKLGEHLPLASRVKPSHYFELFVRWFSFCLPLFFTLTNSNT